jgi:hypothetical protein
MRVDVAHTKKISTERISKVLASYLLCWIGATHSLHAQELLFEGYYKISQNKKHIGYQIQRYEVLPNGFIKHTAYTQIETPAGITRESLTSQSTETLKPVSYSYTSLGGGQSLTIDAESLASQSNSEKLVLKIKKSTSGKMQTQELAVPAGGFLSNLLVYAILKSPEGLKTGTTYSYQTLAEEKAQIIGGKAQVSEETLFRDRIPSLVVTNDFEGVKYRSFVTARGEVLETSATSLGIQVSLVPTREEAIGQVPFAENIIKALFGQIPKGEQNIAYQALQKGTWPKEPDAKKSDWTKQQGVPPGKGLHLKKSK